MASMASQKAASPRAGKPTAPRSGAFARKSGGGGSGSGAGYNQLAFDDNDSAVGGNQQRIHLKTTHSATELSLGHLVHTAANHRGSLRGQGFELRSDAYGAIRAGDGLT